MTTWEDALEELEGDEEVLKADGLEDAFLGIARRCGQTVLVYSEPMALAILAKRAEDDCEDAAKDVWADEHGSDEDYEPPAGIVMDHRECDHYEEAREDFEFNTVGAWMGNGTPLWLDYEPEEFADYIPAYPYTPGTGLIRDDILDELYRVIVKPLPDWTRITSKSNLK